MRLRSILGITLLAIPVSVSADVGVIDDQNQQYALFRQITPTDGQQARRDDVFLVKCEGEPVALTREYCKSKEFLTVTYTEFTVRVTDNHNSGDFRTTSQKGKSQSPNLT